MPTVAQSDIPPPRSWDEFEDLVRDLYARAWGDPHTQRHGRSGQPQQGVDIYGQPRDLGGRYAGIQCKRYGPGELTRRGIEAEIAKAERFSPPLADYTIATSEPCDAPLQEQVRDIDRARRAAGKFPVRVVFWEDLRGLLADSGNSDLFRKHYPQYVPRTPTPGMTPRPLADFVGREEELRSLDAALLPGSRTAITGVIGMGGIGKTELAKLAASRAASRFRDGVLWADCATQTAVAIADLWAAAYERQLPGDDPDAKAAAWRGLIAGKEALLIFDNVQAGQEIEPLFPAQGPSAVLLTTRDGRHPALRGADRLDLDHFTFDEALELARRVLGAEAAEAQAGEARRLFEMVGYLPLAAAVALHAARDSGWSVATLAGKLEAAGALRVLGDDGRLHKSLNATFDTAYRALSAELRETFAALALFNAGPSLSTAALAGTLAIDPDEAQARLSGLAGRSLLRAAGEGRWSLHPLLREHAAARGPVEGEAERRFARHYAGAARAANELYMQGGDGVLGGLALFDLEWPHIRRGQAWAAARSAEDGDAAALASDYPDACAYCLELRLPPRGRIPWLEAAAAAARRLGDKGGEGAHLGNLGLAYADLGDACRAIGYYEQALAIAREIDDRRNEGAWLGNLGLAYASLGDARRAIGYYEQALAIAREICAASRSEAERTAARRAEGVHLGNMGIAYMNLGETQRSIDYYEQALVIAREIGDRHMLCWILLAQALGALGEEENDAWVDRCTLEVQQICEEMGYSVGLTLVLLVRGGLAYVQYDDEQALALWREGHSIAQLIEASGIVATLNVLVALLEGQAGARDQARKLLAFADTELTELGILPELRSFIALVYDMIERDAYPY